MSHYYSTRPAPGESLLDARKRLDRVVQSRAAAPQQSARGLHVSHEPQYLTLDELARRLRFDTTSKTPRESCRQWAHRHAVPFVRRGRLLLFDWFVVEPMLRG